jgi:phage/plasmid-like protein (TIGR03299 family)
MAHEIHQDANGKASFVFVGENTWHGLGQRLTPNSPIPVWIEEAGFNFDIKGTKVTGTADNGSQIVMPDRQLLYRSDTKAALSVVSERYKIVQPAEVLRFYEDLVETGGYTLETAGVLFGGKRMFALAKTNEAEDVVKGDAVKGYLLLSTSCDGSLATSAQFTSVRVVCNNTLSLAIRDGQRQEQGKIRIPHSATFDASSVKAQLSLVESSFSYFMNDMRLLAGRKLNNKEEIEFLVDLFGNPQEKLEDQEPGPANLMKQVHRLYSGAGMGSGLCGRTAWGMLNAVTELVDHHTGHKTDDARMDSAWFGQNAKLKVQARDLLLLTLA